MRSLWRVASALALILWMGLPAQVLAQDVKADGDAQDDKTIELDAEYRVRTVRVDPYELSGTDVLDSTWTEQRLRLDLTMKHSPVTLRVQADVLDGVLFGDNGVFGQDPSPNFGVSLAAKRPNNTRWEVGLPAGNDPLDPDAYVPVLRSADIIQLNHAYADATLPGGLLRVGRQPMAYGASIATHEGTRINRWGVSFFNDTVDRVLFATKLDQAYYILTKDNHTLDLSLDNGIFVGFFYDWYRQGDVQFSGDNLRQIGLPIQFKAQEADWFGLDWRNLEFGFVLVNIQNERFNTNVNSIPVTFRGQVEDFSWNFLSIIVDGESREISEGFAVLTGREPVQQDIEAMGFYGEMNYQVGPVQLSLIGAFAEGDDDPRPDTPVTSLNFARDFNIGLLLFEQILAFESARSVAVGIENLSSLDAASFPITEVSTESRFTNAVALFPQAKIDFLPPESNHKLHLRLGVLFAWPEADGGVVDPILTSLNEDGNEIADDAVNWHGGDPGGYYGTEYDLQIEWSIKNRFFWTVEGAYLDPGSSLQDANGDAVPAFFFENRFTYVF